MANKGVVILGALALGGAMIFAISRTSAAAPPPDTTPYNCPYCTDEFATYEELFAHVQSAHPGERIPIDIGWS
jgi:hypothetical protein